MLAKVMQVITSFWKRQQHPDWIIPATKVVRKHAEQIQHTRHIALKLRHTAEAIVLLCAEEYQIKAKNQIDDTQKKQMWVTWPFS